MPTKRIQLVEIPTDCHGVLSPVGGLPFHGGFLINKNNHRTPRGMRIRDIAFVSSHPAARNQKELSRFVPFFLPSLDGRVRSLSLYRNFSARDISIPPDTVSTFLRTSNFLQIEKQLLITFFLCSFLRSKKQSRSWFDAGL